MNYQYLSDKQVDEMLERFKKIKGSLGYMDPKVDALCLNIAAQSVGLAGTQEAIASVIERTVSKENLDKMRCAQGMAVQSGEGTTFVK